MSCTLEKPLTRDERIAAVGFDYEAQPKQYAPTCNLCGAGKWHVVHGYERAGYPALTVACRHCGLVCLNPRMTREAYAEFYQGWYRAIVSAFSGKPSTPEDLAQQQHDYSCLLADFVAEHIQPTFSTLIDVGGSCGVLASIFAERFNLTATVLDPAPDELAQAELHGCRTIAGFIEDYEPTEKFDLVTMIQTADHLLDLHASLRKLRRLMSLDGILLIDIVDFLKMHELFGIEAATKIDHPYSLTDETFTCYLSRVGLSVLKRGRTTDKRHIIYVCKKANPLPDAMPPDSFVEYLFNRLGVKL